MKIGLFVPCYVDQLYPQAAISTVELLERMPGHRTARRSLLQTLNKEAQRNAALRAERAKGG